MPAGRVAPPSELRLFPSLPTAINGKLHESSRPARLAARFVVPALLACLATPVTGSTTTPEEAGFALAVEARERGRGFGNFTVRQTMALHNKRGRESRRQLRVKVLEAATRKENP